MSIKNRKSESNKVACVIYGYGEKYKNLFNNAVKSFEKFHPDVDVYALDDKTIIPFLYPDTFDFKNDINIQNHFPHPIRPYIACSYIMKMMGYEKVIKLGADTITTSRLEEFLQDIQEGTPRNERPLVLTTLDYYGTALYPYYKDDTLNSFLSYNNISFLASICKVLKHNECNTKNKNEGIDSYFRSEEEYKEKYINKCLDFEMYNLNADVICFNDARAIDEILTIFQKYSILTNDLKAQALVALKSYNASRSVAIMYELSEERKHSLIELVANKNNISIEDIKNNITFFHNLYEQAALNIFHCKYYNLAKVVQASDGDKNIQVVNIVDLTNESNVCYNVRSYGQMDPKNKTKNLKHFYIKNGKFYNHANRIMRVFHYCDSIGSNKELQNSQDLKRYLNDKFHRHFTSDVINYLKDNCNCENIGND
jgi:hypothetical protein